MKRVGTELSRTARWFHALADETRLQIIQRLREGEECVCDLSDSLQSAQSRLSFHLKTLKDAGLIMDRREGRWMYYSLNPSVLDEMIEFIQEMKKIAFARGRSSKCCD
jgi:ArsR family transcriptional regulator